MPFIELSSVDSTNNYALSQLREGLAYHGTAFFAHEQWQGKGQRGKVWAAPRDTSLILSVIIDPVEIGQPPLFHLSICTAISVCEFFSEYAGSDCSIKWPNDLYWQDRKAGGILIENIFGSSGNWKWAVAGMGININQPAFSPDIKNPVSLLQITGKTYDPAQLARKLCEILERNARELAAGRFEELYQRYHTLLYKNGDNIRLKKDNRIFEARLNGVTRDGKLSVQHAINEEFAVGDVEWVIPMFPRG